MQQLTLQFDGYAPIGQSIDAGATKQRIVKHRIVKLSHLLPGWALRQLNPSEALNRVVANVKLYAQGAFCVIFGFAMMFFAAIIGG